MRELSKCATPPELVQYDSWGRRVDELRTFEGWRGLKAMYHREGLVAIPYERQYSEHSRIYGFAKLLMANGDSAVVSLCLHIGSMILQPKQTARQTVL